MTESQRNYSQIQKEALAIIFGLKKFYQYIYGRNFKLVTDHRPLVAMFGPDKGTPTLAANRLARWALMPSQFDYNIEYRRTKDHANADVLSFFPTSDDPQFGREERDDDTQMVCAIEDINNRLSPTDHNSLACESAKDPVISNVIRFIREGWPKKKDEEGTEMQCFRQFTDSLSIINGCLLHCSRVVVPTSQHRQVLEQLHLGHFGK